MSIVDFYNKVEENLKDALKDYSEELADKEKDYTHEWSTKAMQDSIKVTNTGNLSTTVGIHVPTLLQIQWNKNKIDYATLEIGGHRQSPAIPFTRKVDNSEFSNGYWWHVFPAHKAYTPMQDALRDMKDFSSYYKKVK